MGNQKPFNKSIAAKGFSNTFHIMPSKIRCDHRDNSSRAAIYQVADTIPEIAHFFADNAPFCFTLAEVEARLKSFKQTSPRGQITEAHTYMTNTGHPVLSKGYLRHAAMLLAEVRGELDQIEGARTGLRVMRVPMPQSPEAFTADALANYEENEERKKMSSVDLAWFYRRLIDAHKMSAKTVAARCNTSLSTVNKHLQLFKLKPRIVLDIHEGRVKMSAALADASEKGEGGATGPRKGVKHTAIKRAYEALRTQDYAAELLTSEVVYTAQDMLNMIAHIGGIENGSPPQEFLDFITNAPAKPRGRPKGTTKKAPPKQEPKT